MTFEEQLLQEIDRGRQGLNHGIPMGLPKLEGLIDGVTKETYTLILSNSGAGKKFIFLTWGISKIIYIIVQVLDKLLIY